MMPFLASTRHAEKPRAPKRRRARPARRRLYPEPAGICADAHSAGGAELRLRFQPGTCRVGPAAVRHLGRHRPELRRNLLFQRHEQPAAAGDGLRSRRPGLDGRRGGPRARPHRRPGNPLHAVAAPPRHVHPGTGPDRRLAGASRGDRSVRRHALAAVSVVEERGGPDARTARFVGFRAAGRARLAIAGRKAHSRGGSPPPAWGVIASAVS